MSSLRLPSLAGSGLPERMRSTAFAFLGLTAAAGLAFVAIFAQLGFPLLSPAPLPTDPSRGAAIAEAVPLQGGGSVSAPGASTAEDLNSAAPANEGRTGDSAEGTRRTGATAVDPPASAEPAEESPAGGTGDTGGAPDEASTPAPAPAPAAAPEAQPEGPPPSGGSAGSSPGPGGSASSAAAAHANPRALEASAKSRTGSKKESAAAVVVPPAASAAGPSSEEPAPQGKAKGHGR